MTTLYTLRSKMTPYHILCVLPNIHAAVQLLVKLRCEQVGGQGSTLPAWQSASVTSTMPLTQPEQPIKEQTKFRQFTDLIMPQCNNQGGQGTSIGPPS